MTTPTMDVVKQTGATYRQLDYWTRSGYVTPAQAQTQHADPRPIAEKATPGSGHTRLWDDAEIAVIFIMVGLTSWGLAPAAAAHAARLLVTVGVADVAPGVRLARTA